MKKFSINTMMVMAMLWLGACSNNAEQKDAATTPATTGTETAITNPNFSIAPVEYSELAEKALLHTAKFEFDAWGEMLADNIVYSFPDGDVSTRTTLEGKAAVLGWWKNFREKSGIESMSMSEFNHLPINVTGQVKGGATTGIYDICYFSNTLVIKGKPVKLRMNFSIHFNADKKIDRYATYYDRTPIVQAFGGKSLLEDMKVK